MKTANPITLWSLTLLTLTPFARFANWRMSWEGSKFGGKVGKRLESGAIEVPQACEGCTAETKVKLLAERGAFFVNGTFGGQRGGWGGGGTAREKRSSNGPIHKKCTPLS